MEEEIQKKTKEKGMKLEQKEIKMKEWFEKNERRRRLQIELESIKRDERIQEARRLDKIKSYQRLKKLEELEQERQERELIKKEQEKILYLKKSLNANSNIFKSNLLQQSLYFL